VQYSPGTEEHHVLAAEWLGVLHTAGIEIVEQFGLREPGPQCYLNSLVSARTTMQEELSNTALSDEDRSVLLSLSAQCDFLEQHWSQIEECCAGIPRTLIHGDCHGANLRVTTHNAKAAVVAFDWEAAACDNPAVDLALTGLHIPTYWSVVRKVWPNIGIRDLRSLVTVGKIFQLLSMLEWECKGIVSQWRWKLMKHMKFYQIEMREALEFGGFR
jgi:aminoglycoside phosphotransferase (APT) family kinase protein